jgi:glutaconate CoA-transferase subunit A
MALLFDAPKRKSKVIPLEQLRKWVPSGSTVGIGGVHSQNAPMAAIREVIRAGTTGLTIIPTPSAGIAVDMLVGAGAVSTLHVSYVGLEFLGMAPNFKRAAEEGTIDIIEGDEAWIVYGMRAGAGDLPFMPMPPMYEGTDLPSVNPLLKRTLDPHTGREVYTIPPLKPDVCLIHAQVCDIYGNTVIRGLRRFEHVMAKASAKVIVTAERVVDGPLGEDPRVVNIASPQVDAVIEVPYGAHPTSSPGDYFLDEDHLRLYAERSRAGDFDGYRAEFIDKPQDHIAYLESIGLRRLLELRHR